MRVFSLSRRLAVFTLFGILTATAQTPAGPYDTRADAQKDIAAAPPRRKPSGPSF